MRKTSIVMAIVMALTVMTASVALAGGPNDIEKFDKDGWACGEAEGFPENHCLNVNSKGKTLNIKVFLPDARGPQESGTTDPKADTRPCPHDAGGGADPTAGDGTWWDFLYGAAGGPLYVCHHSGQQSK
jgi:hypothetical protein